MSAPKPRPTHCIGCHRKFRPHKSQAVMHPGTVMHSGRGLCTTCHKHRDSPAIQQLTKERETPSPTTLAKHREREAQRLGDLIRERARFEADRARRGIPTTGERSIQIVLTPRFIPVLQEVA